MLQKLIDYFGDDAVTTNPHSVKCHENFYWYITENGMIIGILGSKIDERAKELLSIFLTPYEFHEERKTEAENRWYTILNTKTDSIVDTYSEKIHNYQFVHFTISGDNVDPSAFKEAINGLFPDQTVVVWESVNNGVIVMENNKPTDDPIVYEQVINTLVSDFFINVSLFVGLQYDLLVEAASFYSLEKEYFSISVKHLPNQHIFMTEDAMPFLFINETSDEVKDKVTKSLFQHVAEDQELLHTIQMFIECNLNATLAAKKLYMHRNSLQYRVDKFIEKTGIDVKQFKGAAAVYLALLSFNNKSKRPL